MKPSCPLRIAAALLAAGAFAARAQTSDVDQLKTTVDSLQKDVQEMKQGMADLQKEKAAGTNAAPGAAPAAAMAAGEVVIAPATAEITGHASPITPRGALNDQQEAAPRPNDLTLDPKYRGYIPIPNTPALIKFNAKPRLDMTSDSRNSGNPDRFVTGQIPVEGEPNYGGSEQFNLNARGSALSVDVRAPSMAGNFRFYYNNDFFGSGSGMSYRLKQLYGQFYNFTAGFTYSIFEDPDAWPDTVDFEGPNAVIFARRAVARYMLLLTDQLQLNVGVEAPGAELDAGSTADTITAVNRAPDGGFNLRWEDAKVGHVQGALILRDIGARGPVVGSQSVFGWGVNLATSLNVMKRDSFQGQLTYGVGVFRYFNDDFYNSDAAFDSAGTLQPLPVLGATAAFTHVWSDQFRSTVSYGWVNISNQSTQPANAYHQTHYGSLNLIWQLRKHLSVGVEGLYGRKETHNGASGDVWRAQVGMVYSLFD